MDSVEGGSNGHSGSGFTETSFTFTFDADALGALPTHVGLVWTDIGWNAHAAGLDFEAFGPLGTWLGAIGPCWRRNGHGAKR